MLWNDKEEKGYHLEIKNAVFKTKKCSLMVVRSEEESWEFVQVLVFGLDLLFLLFTLQPRFPAACDC
jgi:hypothetical protein